MSSFTFIVNPAAGKKKGQKLLRWLHDKVGSNRIPTNVILTEGPDHATHLAKDCPENSIVVAVGGDGTINEVANGIAGSSKILGVLPNGSGNDLIKSLRIPDDLDGAFDALMATKTKTIDYGIIICGQGLDHRGNSRKRIFVNGVGIGFDAAVAERTTHITHLSGTALYIAAVFQMLGKYVSPDFEIGLDSDLHTSKNLLIAVGNGRCAGGGFYLTPSAEIDDGLLDVCMIDNLNVPQILKIMPKVMKGHHVHSKGVTMRRCRSLKVTATESFFVHADGEIVGRSVNRVEIQTVQRGLNAIVG